MRKDETLDKFKSELSQAEKDLTHYQSLSDSQWEDLLSKSLKSFNHESFPYPFSKYCSVESKPTTNKFSAHGTQEWNYQKAIYDKKFANKEGIYGIACNKDYKDRRDDQYIVYIYVATVVSKFKKEVLKQLEKARQSKVGNITRREKYIKTPKFAETELKRRKKNVKKALNKHFS